MKHPEEMFFEGAKASQVIDLLKSRRRSAYQCASLSDGYKLGLVLEGGAMRAVYSAAPIEVLTQLGLDRCFDAVYGTSAGAINAAYMLSGKMDCVLDVYKNSVSQNSLKRIFKWPTLFDLNWLFDVLLLGRFPIDIESILNHPLRFFISTTDVETGELVYHDNHSLNTVENMVKVLRASSASPMLTHQWEQLNGRWFNDGNIHAGIPILKAIEDGCTHVVTVLTRERTYRRRPSKLMVALEQLRMRPYGKEYREAFFSGVEIYNQAMELVFSDHSPCANLVIAPPECEPLVSSRETSQMRLSEAWVRTKQRTSNLFESVQ